MRTDEATIKDIIEAGKLLSAFLAGHDQSSFLADLKTRAAVLHQLMVIGEAIKRLSQTTRDAYVSVPWREFAGMRDILIHGYDIVDLNQVWETATIEVPRLLATLEQPDSPA